MLLIPGLLFIIVFNYVPMHGLLMSFQDFNVFEGIWGSPWVGFKHFEKLIGSASFVNVFRNTLLISFYKIIFLFPIPIIIALLLNEIRRDGYKRVIQTIITLPHFLSWVIIAAVFFNILSAGGMVNNIVAQLAGEKISILTNPKYFRGLMVFTQGWKEAGWSAIIYIAEIAGIDQEQYEAAYIDGAGRLHQMLYITIPGIASTIVVLLVMRLGYVLEAGTEQILLFYNPSVYNVGDVIGTYVYRVGLGQMDYSFATAVGFFNSVVGLLLILSGNYASKKITQRSIW